MMEPDAVRTYLETVRHKLATGQATEQSYRAALEILAESFDAVCAVNDPKRSEYGAPDFVFKKRPKEALILGYAEAKDIPVNLDTVEKSEQMRRYMGYSNLFLTNYLEFRFFRNGEKYESISIAKLQDGKLKLMPGRFDALAAELAAFLEQSPEPITNAVRLAEVMGAKARRIRLNVERFLSVDSEKNEELLRIYALIKELLVRDLDEARFADMYAQTLVYGLFAARHNDDTPETFTRSEARDLVPASNPFLREFFDHIAGPRFDFRLAYIVDELCAVFAASSVREIVHKQLALTGLESDDKDPIIHFYEDFLKAYDPQQRKRMGAYYTPLPVVRFMVRTVDQLLKRDFGLSHGLADTSKTTTKVVRQDKKTEVEFHKVQILDPAAGTATFLNEVIEFIHQGFNSQEGRWPSYAKEDLIPRLHGFELMMAPYTVAHLKLGLTLRETGVDDFGRRLGVYLTNTLEEGLNQPQTLFHFGLADAVAEEAIHAGEVKTERPIMVVIGNPPYSGSSSNETDFANALVDGYKVEPGGQLKLQERKHWLNDDYVKFIAFAEAMIKKNGSGIVAMITNHGYLDNPTFRGMRWRLAQTFDAIYVLDLHGNAKKKEVAPDGGKDENVFDIQQGVAIMFGVLTGAKKAGDLAEVSNADLYGLRRSKFESLNAGDVEWREIETNAPMHYFAYKDRAGEREYMAGVALDQLFGLSSTGVFTLGDSFIISHERDDLADRVMRVERGHLDESQLDHEFELGKNYAKWVTENQATIAFDESKLARIAYRPFDDRWTYFDNKLVWRPRTKVMQHFLCGENVGLTVGRQGQVVGAMAWNLVAIADHIVDLNYFYRGGEQVSPLYLYHDDGTRTPNFNADKLGELTANIAKDFEPEDILDYIFGVLHSPAYREKYKEFLKTDFPRAPVPTGDEEFERFRCFGQQLRELHLMTSPECSELITTFPKAGSDEVDKPRYEDDKVWINSSQYFGGVPEVAWNFYIGGYQPAQKWLKDRRGRKLMSDDIKHYQKIVKVLAETHAIMGQIDN